MSSKVKNSKAAEIKCEICSDKFSSYGLPAHIKHSHEISVDAYVSKFGEFRKSKIQENKKNIRDVQKIKCGECGKTYSSTGMYTHLRYTHEMNVEEYVEKHGEYRKKQKERKKKKQEINDDFACEICGEHCISERQLSFHVKGKHGIEKNEYVLEHIFDGKHPKCKCGCGENAKILSYSPYKRDYISGHNSKGESNPMYGKKHSKYTKELMLERKFQRLKNRLKEGGIKALFEYEDYQGVDYEEPYTIYELVCTNCDTKFESDLRRSRIPSCPNCVNNGISKQHLEIREFLNELNIKYEENNRKKLQNHLELDFYLPDHDLAIEFNGIYWHSEHAGGKSKTYHLNKTQQCEQLGIHLIHIFEDEWRKTPEIVKSRLKYILGMHKGERVYARNCEVREINPSVKNEFLNENHIQGEDRSSLKYGLFHEDELVSVMTFSKPRAFQSASYEAGTWEISRFASDRTKVVVGSFGKLFQSFLRNEDPNQVISYADRRYTYKPSNVYKKHGFEIESDGTPNYWYTDYMERKHRYNFTKSKIVENYDGDPSKTEWKNMIEMGYDRIWDCGHLKYVWIN